MQSFTFWIQVFVAGVALALVVAQLFVGNKRALHLVFAVFCGSISIFMIQQAGADSLGVYQYVLGLGACATCNGYWLVARALFRTQKPFAFHHIALAACVALLVMTNQGVNILQTSAWAGSAFLAGFKVGVVEIMGLLSSTLLVLAFWEGCRNWPHADRAERRLRWIFLNTYGGAVMLCTVVMPMLKIAQPSLSLGELSSAICALAILCVSQWLITLRDRTMHTVQQNPLADTARITTSAQTAQTCESSFDERELAETIRLSVRQKQLYLHPDWKLADLAQYLGAPHYRVSRAVNGALGAANYSQFINQHRIAHAKTLLTDPSKDHWSILVIGMESGFASLGPFNRAFKAGVGCTPSDFRAGR